MGCPTPVCLLTEAQLPPEWKAGLLPTASGACAQHRQGHALSLGSGRRGARAQKCTLSACYFLSLNKINFALPGKDEMAATSPARGLWARGPGGGHLARTLLGPDEGGTCHTSALRPGPAPWLSLVSQKQVAPSLPAPERAWARPVLAGQDSPAEPRLSAVWAHFLQ